MKTLENKHYIRLEGNKIIKGFSDVFEQPQDGDICIGEGGRHFELNGQCNPPLADGGVYLYKYENGEIIALTQEEIEASKPIQIEQTPIEEQLAREIIALQNELFELKKQLIPQ